MQNEPLNAADQITRTAAHLSMVEIIIGSLVHGLKLPFAGQILSLNQGAFLCRSLQYSTSRRQGALKSFEISGVASVLKSLSPAGNKIGPMLSIGMQGALFALGLVIGGLGLAGQALAMLLLSVWAFIQPFVSLFVIYGSDLEKVFYFYSERVTKEVPAFANSVSTLLFVAVGIKFILATAIPFLVYFIGEEKIQIAEDRYIKRMASFRRKDNISPMNPARGAFYDMTRPLFLFSTILVVVFFFLTESNYTKIFWLTLRPLALAFVLFYLIRSPSFLSALQKLSRKSSFLDQIYQQAIQSRLYIDQKFIIAESLKRTPR